MNREIKFRIWDYDNKSFYYVDINNIDNVIETYDSIRDYFHSDYLKDNPNFSQQFTGLMDMYKNDIYEGDIVEYSMTIQNYDDDDILNPRHYRTPQYERRTFKKEVKFMNGSFISTNNVSWSALKVIGNIHENPELLK